MKTFPTDRDLAVLSLCVLLLVALGVRLAGLHHRYNRTA